MRGTAFHFFVLAVLLGMLGMAWGIQMAISTDHTLKSAHAHLNLVGWVSLAIFGIYYALTPSAAQGLARLHLFLSGVGVIVFVIGIALAILEKTEAVVAVGSLIVLAGMLLFLVILLRNGIGQP